jgi:cell division protease FtsH
MIDFESAKDKVMMGAERRSMVMSEDEKRLTAYHEAGPCRRGPERPAARPDPQGDDHPARPGPGPRAVAAERDQLSVSYTKYRSKIAMAMGGRVAEELVFGPEQVTSGATSDIQQVSKIARAMVTQFGMSRPIGYIDYANEQAELSRRLWRRHEPFGRDAGADRRRGAPPDRRGLHRGQAHPDQKFEDLDRLAKGLLEYETLTGSEITRVIAGEPLNRGDDRDDTPPQQGPGASVSAIPEDGWRPASQRPEPEPSV